LPFENSPMTIPCSTRRPITGLSIPRNRERCTQGPACETGSLAHNWLNVSQTLRHFTMTSVNQTLLCLMMLSRGSITSPFLSDLPS
jgi:hypothetical protein